MNEALEHGAVTEERANKDFALMLKAARVKWEIYSQFQGRDGELDKLIIIDAIMDGRVTINEEGFPTVYPETENERLKEIKLMRRSTRGEKLAMDRVKEGHDVAKQDAVLGKYLGIAPKLLGVLEDRDYNLINCLWTIFLGY